MGGGARFRSGSTIGYALRPVTLPNGTTASVTDLGHPHRSSEEITWDALVRYQFKLSNRLTGNVQLNVRNLLEENTRVRSAAFSTGITSIYSSQEPRTMILETTVKF